MRVIDAGEARTKSYRIHLMEMVINAIYYNAALSLQVLEAKGWTNKFFSAWFANIDNFRRVHDKKLSIAAISSLLTLPAGEVPVSVQQGWPRLLQGVTRLFQTLPAALKRKPFSSPSWTPGLSKLINNIEREDATKESDFTLDDEDDDDDEENDWDGDVEWDENEVEAALDDDVADESAAYLDFLNQEAQKFGSFADDDDDDMDEESLLETPLDKVEPYGMFKHVLLST
jgi:hypothetical protein